MINILIYLIAMFLLFYVIIPNGQKLIQDNRDVKGIILIVSVIETIIILIIVVALTILFS